MGQIQGHYWGSTWAGATPPSGLPRRFIAALVAPAHVLPEARVRTGPVLTEYQDWPQSRPEGEQ